MQRDGFQRRPGDVGFVGAARHAHHGSPGMTVPIRGAQTGKGRHQIDVAGIANTGRKPFNLVRRAEQLQAVAQPLNGGARHENRTLQCITGLALGAHPGHRAEQLVLTGNGRGSGVHEHEAARAIGVFGHARFETRLAKRGSLLITRDTGDFNRRAKKAADSLRDHPAAGYHLWQHRRRDAKQAQQFGVPLQGVNVEQQGARCIAGVGDMAGPAGEVPDQPAVDRAKSQFAPFGAGPRLGDVIEQPLQLGA